MKFATVCSLLFSVCTAAPQNGFELEFNANELTDKLQNVFSINKNRDAAVQDALNTAFYGTSQAYNVMVCTSYAYSI
jgi:hypothetical protein